MQCPFLHNGEKAKRRDPRKYAYSATACAEFRKTGSCVRGDACSFAHGVFECWLHPARYRTQLCTDGLACARPVCFFAHQESELRQPGGYLPLPAGIPAAPQLQSEARASMEAAVAMQPELASALQTLLEEERARHEAALTMAAQMLDPLAKLRLLRALQQQEQRHSFDHTAPASIGQGLDALNSLQHSGNERALLSALQDLSLKTKSGDTSRILQEALSQQQYGSNFAKHSVDPAASQRNSAAAGLLNGSSMNPMASNAFVGGNPNLPSGIGMDNFPVNRRSVDIGALSRTELSNVASSSLPYGRMTNNIDPSIAAAAFVGASAPLEPNPLNHQTPTDLENSVLARPASTGIVGSLPTATYMQYAAKNGPTEFSKGSFVEYANEAHLSRSLNDSASGNPSFFSCSSPLAAQFGDVSSRQQKSSSPGHWVGNSFSPSAIGTQYNNVRRAGSAASSALQSIEEGAIDGSEDGGTKKYNHELSESKDDLSDSKRSECNTEGGSSGEDAMGRCSSGSFVLDGIGATSVSSDAQEDSLPSATGSTKTSGGKDQRFGMGRIMSFEK